MDGKRVRVRGPLRAVVVLALAGFVRPALGGTLPELHLERIGTPGGPPPEVVTSVVQDRGGLIWIASRSGLFLFDGYTYTTFQHDPSDVGSLSDSDIRTLYLDPDGTLWVGTNTAGLNRFEPSTGSFAHFRHASEDAGSLSHDSVYAIQRDRKGRLWVGTQQGLNRLDPGARGFVRMAANGPEGLSNDYVMALCEDRAGDLWVGTLGGGLFRWDESAGRFRNYRHDPADPRSLLFDRVAALLEDDAGRLWIATLRGLSRLDVDRHEFLNVPGEPGKEGALQVGLVTSLARGDRGRIWVGTLPGALGEVDAETGRVLRWQRLPGRPYNLSEDAVYALMSDRDGALWVGAWGGGLSRVSRTALRLGGIGNGGFPPPDVPSRDVTTILHDRRGGVWIGTRSGYLVRLDPSRGRYEVVLRGGSAGVPRILIDLQEDPSGRIWIATNGGLLRFDPQTKRLRQWEHHPHEVGSLGPGYVNALTPDGAGGFWVGTGEGGLQRIDGEGVVRERFRHRPGDPASLSDDYVTRVLPDRAGRLWIGTRSGGLNELDPSTGRVKRYLPIIGDPTSLGHHCVTSLLEDGVGRIWVGTAGGGLNRVDRRDDGSVLFERIDEGSGLIDDDVTGLLEDDDGSLWIATRRGLSRFQPERRAFTSVYVSDGLPSAEFEPHAVARDASRLYFGTVRGLAVLPAGSRFEPAPPSPVVIRSLRTAAGEVSPSALSARDGLSLPYEGWLSVEFAVLDYGPEREHRYAYELDGTWVDIGQRRELTFTSLRPGRHVLRVRGRNGQGVWEDGAQPLTITVVPPFWMTPGFQLASVLAIAGIVLGAHWWRTSTLEKRHRELVDLHRQREQARGELDATYQRLRRLTIRLEAAKEDERQRIARELHDEMGPSLTAVIINLQLLASSASPEKSARKIADTIDLVDRLVERVRDISFELRPPLIDELGLVAALSGYLEKVSERTGIRISRRGDASVRPLTADVRIAAFRIAQEAVTNAVRHAGASRIDVFLRRTGDALEVRVEDDGLGFDVRETMERAATGKALGLLGMRERVGILNGTIEIDSAPGRGTTIRVTLPVAEAA